MSYTLRAALQGAATGPCDGGNHQLGSPAKIVRQMTSNYYAKKSGYRSGLSNPMLYQRSSSTGLEACITVVCWIPVPGRKYDT